YRLGKTLEAVHAGNEDVFHATVLQFCDNLEPELGSLGLCRPHAEDFLDPLHGDGNGKVHGLVDYLSVMPHLDPDGIEVDNRVDLIERATLPEFDFFRYRIGNLRDQCWRYFHPINFFQMSLNVSRGHPTGIHGNDLVVESGKAAFSLGENHRVKGGIAIPRDSNIKVAKFTFYGLL